MKTKLPLVYACSGASSAAQMANHIAVKLDRLKVAEMSCIAGVGGDVKPLVQTAKSGRPIIALDGCPLQCAGKILQKHGLVADKHVDLSAWGVQKRKHEDFDARQAVQVLQRLLDAPDFPKGPPPAASESNAPASAAAGELDAEPVECASPPCYLSAFQSPRP
jgi:uncharacterized metal-binding protein